MRLADLDTARKRRAPSASSTELRRFWLTHLAIEDGRSERVASGIEDLVRAYIAGDLDGVAHAAEVGEAETKDSGGALLGEKEREGSNANKEEGLESWLGLAMGWRSAWRRFDQRLLYSHHDVVAVVVRRRDCGVAGEALSLAASPSRAKCEAVPSGLRYRDQPTHSRCGSGSYLGVLRFGKAQVS